MKDVKVSATTALNALTSASMLANETVLELSRELAKLDEDMKQMALDSTRRGQAMNLARQLVTTVLETGPGEEVRVQRTVQIAQALDKLLPPPRKGSPNEQMASALAAHAAAHAAAEPG